MNAFTNSPSGEGGELKEVSEIEAPDGRKPSSPRRLDGGGKPGDRATTPRLLTRATGAKIRTPLAPTKTKRRQARVAGIRRRWRDETGCC